MVVLVMFQRIRLLRVMLHAGKWMLHKCVRWHTKVEASLTDTVISIHRNPIVFFTKRCADAGAAWCLPCVVLAVDAWLWCGLVAWLTSRAPTPPPRLAAHRSRH